MSPKLHTATTEDSTKEQPSSLQHQRQRCEQRYLAGSTSEAHLTAHAERMPSWIEETIQASQRDTRRQPWRVMFGESVDCHFDDGEDLVRIERSVGGRFDPDCPFRTQGSSLAA